MWAAVFTPTADEIAKEIVAEEARLRALEEKAYCQGYKEAVIKRLRNHEEGFQLMRQDNQPIYTQFTQDDIADFIERGELRLIELHKLKATAAEWIDNARPEAQDPRYLEYKKRLKAAMKEDTQCRIISC